jgi:hypothetical protein
LGAQRSGRPDGPATLSLWTLPLDGEEGIVCLMGPPLARPVRLGHIWRCSTRQTLSSFRTAPRMRALGPAPSLPTRTGT